VGHYHLLAHHSTVIVNRRGGTYRLIFGGKHRQEIALNKRQARVACMALLHEFPDLSTTKKDAP